ncbi:hypothetical protein MMPV_005532 [Pyropia vietnamensis]
MCERMINQLSVGHTSLGLWRKAGARWYYVTCDNQHQVLQQMRDFVTDDSKLGVITSLTAAAHVGTVAEAALAFVDGATSMSISALLLPVQIVYAAAMDPVHRTTIEGLLADYEENVKLVDDKFEGLHVTPGGQPVRETMCKECQARTTPHMFQFKHKGLLRRIAQKVDEEVTSATL